MGESNYSSVPPGHTDYIGQDSVATVDEWSRREVEYKSVMTSRHGHWGHFDIQIAFVWTLDMTRLIERGFPSDVRCSDLSKSYWMYGTSYQAVIFDRSSLKNYVAKKVVRLFRNDHTLHQSRRLDLATVTFIWPEQRCQILCIFCYFRFALGCPALS